MKNENLNDIKVNKQINGEKMTDSVIKFYIIYNK
jgi:hypothetical protein